MTEIRGVLGGGVNEKNAKASLSQFDADSQDRGLRVAAIAFQCVEPHTFNRGGLTEKD